MGLPTNLLVIKNLEMFLIFLKKINFPFKECPPGFAYNLALQACDVYENTFGCPEPTPATHDCGATVSPCDGTNDGDFFPAGECQVGIDCSMKDQLSACIARYEKKTSLIPD